ncbi:MAG: class II fructose-bisphosphate aldolase [Acidimicrobiia bacterium]
MPIATPETYRAMLDAARRDRFALPAINVTSSITVHAALAGFAEAESDGIIQVSTGAAEFASGLYNRDMVLGGAALAEFAHAVADRYPINVALHTDHCQPDKVDAFIRPLLALSAQRRQDAQGPLFQSHMLDASELPLEDNLAMASQLLEECAALDIVLELEIGIVGGVEDAMDREDVERAKLYTSPADMLRTAEVLGTGERGRYLLAAVFGNVHGVYKPGSVELDPTILRDGQAAVGDRFGADARHYLVFHGGSGSSLDEIHETLDYGVIKMNIDTDTQYAFTEPIARHMLADPDAVIRSEGNVGDKKAYDPRSYLKKAEASMSERVVQACRDLRSVGTTLGGEA